MSSWLNFVVYNTDNTYDSEVARKPRPLSKWEEVAHNTLLFFIYFFLAPTCYLDGVGGGGGGAEGYKPGLLTLTARLIGNWWEFPRPNKLYERFY